MPGQRRQKRIFTLILLYTFIFNCMFKLCHSVQIVTEHHYYLETQKRPNNKSQTHRQSNRKGLSLKGIKKQQQKYQHLPSYRSARSCPQDRSDKPQKKGIKITTNNKGHFKQNNERKPHQRPLPQKDYHPIFQNTSQNSRQAQQSSKRAFATHTQMNQETSVQESFSSKHVPHPLLRKPKKDYLEFRPKSNLSTSQKYSFDCLVNDLKSAAKIVSKGPDVNRSQSEYSQNTRKKEYKYDCRNSQQTSFSRTCSGQKHENTILKQACVYSSSPSKVKLLPVHKLPQSKGPISTSKLYDARSIISRDESNPHFDDLNLQESILLTRQIDIFQTLRPTYQMEHYQLARAVDQRNQHQVALKIFTESENEAYQHQLQVFRAVQQTIKLQSEVEILKLFHIFMDDKNFDKKIFFVYEPFQNTLKQYLQGSIKGKSQRIYYISRFISKLKVLIEKLALQGITLNLPLKVDDFVQGKQGWKLASLTKFKIAREREVYLMPKSWLADLQEDLLRSF